MTKFVSAIVGAIEIGVGIATLNPELIIAGVATEAAVLTSLLAHPTLTPPDTTTTALKSPTPPRVSGYGRNRLHFAWESDQ